MEEALALVASVSGPHLPSDSPDRLVAEIEVSRQDVFDEFAEIPRLVVEH